ncbi:MAG: hypothetical protein COW24_01005 [Candidatus Kerfeldbacteria bacterium CG15_BIG_FIL_POST_REV_8_21_14_020_45_12]|uniref:Uncharacterized protein n=1 Tax=Candidatus Kerfeldbacteria bacterium CG15_BIG_FIL_POST_REV_8_21_14_020_45_12 TaxID=2014247 RepID=A0A2M7H4W5_9BACT|nr:MAG: hypothetical protein COW24_01005 [Candidatus Kerfeldbacteria bacterium CG15_BIG_FIL_POST_REV_8_21_14_020_45_12]PJA93783.1 MAG: hypothetical protein CO132_01490 [Candidatus Kerfeldbacteria bacterium CG_4_9_14_3_um_filter_45_8]
MTGNYEELRNFIKKIGSNLLLRERKVGLAWQNAWELLAKRVCGCGAGGHEFSQCTDWQGLADVFGTFDWPKLHAAMGTFPSIAVRYFGWSN